MPSTASHHPVSLVNRCIPTAMSAASGCAWTLARASALAQFRRIATPSTITRLPLELTAILSVPVRAELKVATVITFWLTVVRE